MDGSRLLCNSRPSPGRISRFAELVYNPHESRRRSVVAHLFCVRSRDLAASTRRYPAASHCCPKHSFWLKRRAIVDQSPMETDVETTVDRLGNEQLEKLKIKKASSVARLVRKVSPQGSRLTGHDR